VYARNAALSPPGSGELNAARAFQAKTHPGLIRGGARAKKARQTKNLESRFDSIETEKTLGMIQQLKVRQQVHGEIAASVAVAAVATDAGHLNCALIELNVVALISHGC
jgi:hypothetical protein